MTLTIHLPDSLRDALEAKAKACGVSAEQFACDLLEQQIETVPHISEVLSLSLTDLAPEIVSQLPTDGASEHDHYLYGLPKRGS